MNGGGQAARATRVAQLVERRAEAEVVEPAVTAERGDEGAGALSRRDTRRRGMTCRRQNASQTGRHGGGVSEAAEAPSISEKCSCHRVLLARSITVMHCSALVRIGLPVSGGSATSGAGCSGGAETPAWATRRPAAGSSSPCGSTLAGQKHLVAEGGVQVVLDLIVCSSGKIPIMMLVYQCQIIQPECSQRWTLLMSYHLKLLMVWNKLKKKLKRRKWQ